jgi:hypothetical protein
MTNTLPNDARELKVDELDCVTGGDIKGAVGVCNRYDGTDKKAGDQIKAFQQLLQEI